MKKVLILVAIVIAWLIGFGMGIVYQFNENLEKPQPSERITYRPFSQQILWTHIQDYKTTNGLQPYIQDQKLCEYAETRLKELPKQFSHDGFRASIRAFRTTNNYATAGENLARFSYASREPNELDQLNSWLKSPTHKENLDNPTYTLSCLRCNQNYCVHIFAGY